MESWRAYIPVVADSHKSDEEQEHDPNQDRIHINVTDWARIRIRNEVKGLIRIQIKVIRILNPGIFIRMHRVSQNYSGIAFFLHSNVKYGISLVFAKIIIHFFVKCDGSAFIQELLYELLLDKYL